MIEMNLNLAAARGTSVVASIVKNDGKFEPEIVSLLLHVFKVGRRGLFVDVGSNIGFFPLILSKYNECTGTDVEIIGHEPLPQLQAISRKLQVENSVQYNLQSIAASDFTGTADFFVSAVSDSSNSLVAGFRKSKDVITVVVDTVDNLYSEKLRLGKYDEAVLMIDVETAEPAVLRGAKTILQKFRPLIVCEVLSGRTEPAITAVLKDVNYATYRFDGEQWRLEKTLFGDKTYKHRDWFFVPSERCAEFGASFSIAPSHRLTVGLV